jgi:hypothetical protein
MGGPFGAHEINKYKTVALKPGGRKPLRKHRHGWENNKVMDIREIGSAGVD